VGLVVYIFIYPQRAKIIIWRLCKEIDESFTHQQAHLCKKVSELWVHFQCSCMFKSSWLQTFCVRSHRYRGAHILPKECTFSLVIYPRTIPLGQCPCPQTFPPDARRLFLRVMPPHGAIICRPNVVNTDTLQRIHLMYLLFIM